MADSGKPARQIHAYPLLRENTTFALRIFADNPRSGARGVMPPADDLPLDLSVYMVVALARVLGVKITVILR
jgi:hypothetical protein